MTPFSFAVKRLAPVLFILLLPPLRADHVRLLETVEDAANCRIDLIRQAHTTIDVAYFLFEDDETGLAMIWLLRDAVQRGVKVRLIIDSQWNKVSTSLMKHLADEGLVVGLYHPFRFGRPFWITRRMHDKLLIVDGLHLVSGGRNIANSYFGSGVHNYIDRDIYTAGTTAEQASQYFDQLWKSSHVDMPNFQKINPKNLIKAKTLLDEQQRAMASSPFFCLDGKQIWAADSHLVDEIRFIFDPIQKTRKRAGIRHDLLDLVAQAEREILIESPYLVVDKALMNYVRIARDRGIRIRILTNSIHATDNLFAQAGYRGRKQKLALLGVELWEYQGPQSLHSKTALIDGQGVIVGSYNIDPRSARLNTEVAISFENEAISSEIAATMHKNLENAVRIGIDGKPINAQERPLALWKRFKLCLINLFLPLIWDQL